MMGSLTTGCYILVLVAVSHGYDICYIDNLFRDTLCEYGCCGSGDNKYCCPNTNYHPTLPVPAIVGIAVGVVVFFIVSCIVCSACFCNNASRRARGQVVGSNYPMSVVVAGTPNTAYAPGYVGPPQPAPVTHYPGDAGTTFPPPPYPVQTGAYYQQPTALPTTYP
ncbi:protein shisa-4-like [Haliotis rufescens]|uniref:protein shisa-4-like n=1 Tax=Haliotis rufescens TaxID=6454 RepID=UPI00201E9127|nr:protein shisa-4-like [Haliotis rufescens]